MLPINLLPLILSFLLLTLHTKGQAESGFVEGRVIVKFKEHTEMAVAEALLNTSDYHVSRIPAAAPAAGAPNSVLQDKLI